MPLGGLEWRRQTGRLDAPWWNVHRFPLPSLIEAGAIRLLGARDIAISLSSALFFFLTIPLLFLIARRMFPFRVALLGVALFAFCGGPMEDSFSGLTEPAAIFFFLAALYLVLWPRKWWHIPLAGLITGLAFLNRYSVVLYAFPMLALVWRARPRRPLAALAAFAVPGALVTVPWLYRDYVVAGAPLFSITTALMVRYMTAASPRAHDWYQFVYESPGHFWLQHPWWAIKKWLMQTGDMWWNGFEDVGDIGFVLPFFVLSILQPMNGTAERLRRWLFGVFLLHFVVLGLLSNIPRYYAIFTPFLCLYAAAALAWLWSFVGPRMERRYIPAAAFLAFPLFLNWLYILGPARRPREDRTWVEYTRTNQDWLRHNTPKGALIVSDVPWSVAWYGNRRSVPLPPTPDDMDRFPEYHVQPDGIYLKSPRKRMNVPDGWDEWRRVQYGGLPVPGYRLAHTFEDGSAYYQRIMRPR
jgi:4-amino-4-deoxy-L-arabinose transferase-like glycosyltransferase